MKYHSTPFFMYLYNLQATETYKRLQGAYTEGGISIIPNNEYRNPELQKIKDEFGLNITILPPNEKEFKDWNRPLTYYSWVVTIDGIEDELRITTLFNDLSAKLNVDTMWNIVANNKQSDEFIGIVDFGPMNMGYPFLGVIRNYYSSHEDHPTEKGAGITAVRSHIVVGFITGNIDDIIGSNMFTEEGTVEDFERLNGVRITRLTYSEACRKLLAYYAEKYPEVDGEITYKIGSQEYKTPSFYTQLRAAL